ANAEPYRQRILHRSRIDALACQGSPMFAGPMDMLVLADLQEQIELLRKKRVVVLQFQAEQWKRLDEGTAAYDHFCPALREKIEGSEVLIYPHGVGGTQDGYGTREADALR